MRRLFRNRFAVSSVVALLIVMLLIGTFVSALLYISSLQMQNIGEGTKPVEQFSEAEREKIDAQLVSSDGGLLRVKVKNTGLITLKITQVLLIQADRSPVFVDINPDVTLVMLEEAEITVPYSGSFQAIGLQTERGNVFPVVTGTVVQQATCTLTFYIRDESGNAVGVATLVFNGASYSDGQSANVATGSYTLSTGNIPSGYAFASWEAGGGVTVSSATSPSTTVTVSGSGTVTMKLSSFNFSVSISPSSGSTTPGGSVTSTVTVTLTGGSPLTVSLSASGLPTGSSASFSPASGSPTFSSTMTISTSTSTPTGTYTITITGSGGGLSRTATYVLTVSPAPPETATVTFSVSGMGSDASGTVLTVDGVGYTYSDLPKSFTWNVGSTHSFAWADYVSAGSGKRYAWVSTSGLSTSRSGSITVSPGGGSVSATYKTQYQWAFSASGLSSDASGTVVTIDGTNYVYTQLPISFWWDGGSSHSYSYQQYVSSTTSGKRYANHNPPSWSGTVSGSNNLNPSYHVEYQLTINVSPSGAGTTSPAAGSYWYDSGSSVSVSATPNTGCTFSKWQLDGSDYSTNNPISVTMSSPHTLTAVFTGAMYALTVYVYRSGTSTAISGVTVKVDGASYTTDSSGRVSLSVSSGSHAVEVVSPYSPSSGTRYVFTQWSDGSTANPRTISVTTDTVLTAYMKLQYYLTMNVESGSGTVSPSSGWYDAGSSVFISASPSAGYAFDYWVGSGSGSYTGSSSSTTITISAPITQTAYFFSFSISISPNSGSCQQGGSISATVTVTYVSGYNSKTISLSASGLPSGASASFNPSSVTISPSTTTASSTMTTSTSTSTPTGTYTITITGTGGGITRTTTYSLTISTSTATVTFSVSGMGSDASGTVLTVDGTNYAYNQLPVSFTWDVGSTHSFTWTDYVSAGTGKRYAWTSTSGLSTSRSGSITVSPGGGSVSATYKTQYYLTMQASPSNGGSVSPSSGWYDVGYSVSISASPASGWAFERWIGSGSGSYSGTSSSSSVTMNAPITETAYFYTFSVSVSPTSGSTTPGGSVTATVTVTLTGGYSSSITVSFSASGLPSGASASFSPASVTISPSSPTATSTMTISTSTSTPTGTYSITVTASGGGLSKTTTYALTVSAAFDFSISASPSSLSICRGASKISTITVTLVSGSATTVSLSASSSPSGLSFSFSPSSGSPTFTSTLTITAPSGVSLGTYTVTVTGSGGGKTHSTTITVYVNDFSISVIPQSDSIYKGASKTATVLVTSTTGSASSMTVSLSASNVPSGVSVSFSSSSVTVGAGSSATSTMTVTVSTSASVGTYTITITGSSNCGTSKTTTYTLTINEPPVTVTFYAKFQKNGAYQNAWGSATVLNVDGNAYTAAQVGSGVSFTWAVGSQHYVSWYSGIYYDESSYLTGTDARYDWSYSSGIFTSQNGYLTVPSGGGTVTAYYSRTIEVIVSVNPSGGGSVSPSSGWYTEGTSFTATANSGYQFHHWVVKRGNSPETTSTSNPYYMYDPGYLTAVFYIRVLVYAWDSEYNLFRNSGVYISLQNIGGKYTNANGYAEFYVPPDYSGTLTASSTGTGYNSKSLPFWKWGDGVTSNPRTIYVYQPATYSAFYKCVLSFYKLAIIDNFPGAIWQPKATADGIVYVTTAKNAYGKNGITVQATFNYLIGSGSHTDTTHYGTINFFGTSITSDGTFHIEHWAGYGFQITSAEVKTLAGEGYVNAQITATTFPVRIG